LGRQQGAEDDEEEDDEVDDEEVDDEEEHDVDTGVAGQEELDICSICNEQLISSAPCAGPCAGPQAGSCRSAGT